MNKTTKLSDRALQQATNSNWRWALRATRMRRFVQRGLVTLGVGWAVALPFLNTADDSDGKPAIAPTVNNMYLTPSPAVEDHASNVTNITNTGGESENPAGVVEITVLNVFQVQSAPANKIWHRSAFRAVNDEFWALPDSSFKLKLLAVNDAGCSLTACSAKFRATFLDFQNVTGDGYQISLSATAPNIQTTIASDVCQTVDAINPFLICRLVGKPTVAGATNATNPDLCLWLRRADKTESGTESVAIDIRWQRVTVNESEDRNCSGDFPIN